MPYIDPIARQTFRPTLSEIKRSLTCFDNDNLPGALNFLVSRMLADQIDARGMSYHFLNEMIGMLECCKQELYRRVAAPYEDKAMERNGDVY